MAENRSEAAVEYQANARRIAPAQVFPALMLELHLYKAQDLIVEFLLTHLAVADKEVDKIRADKVELACLR